MRIARLRLKNWLIFRGEHELRFEAKPYAIVAHHADNPERSNWSGKSSFVESIRFAMFGTHRHRLDDEWITDDEQFGEVEIEFDTGERILRTRERGRKAGFFYFPERGGSEAYYKAEAQNGIIARTKLDERDFLATAYFEQRQMARLILARPEERMNMIATWIKLGPIEACEDRARDIVNKHVSEMQAHKDRLAIAEQRLKDKLGGASIDLAEHQHAKATLDVRVAADALAKAERAFMDNDKVKRAWESRREFEALSREGRALSTEVNERDLSGMQEACEIARAASEEHATRVSTLYSERAQVEKLAKGQFDGKCPIAPVVCPAASLINSQRAEHKSRLLVIEDSYATACAAQTEAKRDERRLFDEYTHAEKEAARLTTLRERANKILEAGVDEEAPEPEDSEVLRHKVIAARDALDEAKRNEARAREALDLRDEVAKVEAEVNEACARIEKVLAPARAGLVVFGKNGAQRKMAEDVLGFIEQRANERLAKCGIDLSVEFMWTREGTGLAKACDFCGAAFPRSEKVKLCERCGAARGPNLINKLDFAMSDRSGAAEDLVGISVQLAASEWLFADRQSDWSTLVIDEAFGQLDAANRRALSHHLASLIGARQAFLIAHHAQVLDALPGRIEITRGRNGSTVKVAA